MTDVTTDWMELYSGRKFDLDFFGPDDVDLEDIAQSLSQQCRYNGHTTRFYSTAEHCGHIAEWLWRETQNADLALAGLLHDANEAYLSDLPRPTKPKFPNFRAYEDVLDATIAHKFRVPWPWPPLIREADSRIINDERAALFRESGNEWLLPPGCDKPLGVKISAVEPTTARLWFMKVFEFLDKERARG